MFRSIRPPGPHQTVCHYIDLFNCFVLRGEQKSTKQLIYAINYFLKLRRPSADSARSEGGHVEG